MRRERGAVAVDDGFDAFDDVGLAGHGNADGGETLGIGGESAGHREEVLGIVAAIAGDADDLVVADLFCKIGEPAPDEPGGRVKPEDGGVQGSKEGGPGVAAANVLSFVGQDHGEELFAPSRPIGR